MRLVASEKSEAEVDLACPNISKVSIEGLVGDEYKKTKGYLVKSCHGSGLGLLKQTTTSAAKHQSLARLNLRLTVMLLTIARISDTHTVGQLEIGRATPRVSQAL